MEVGGITPDIFIAQDTVGYTSYYGDVVSRGVLVRFTFEYADKYRNALTNTGSPMALYQFLYHQGLPWRLASYARKLGVPPPPTI